MSRFRWWYLPLGMTSNAAERFEMSGYRCGHTAPNVSARRVPGQTTGGAGGRYRKSPTGGAAYGTPLNASTVSRCLEFSSRIMPLIAPVLVSTILELYRGPACVTLARNANAIRSETAATPEVAVVSALEKHRVNRMVRLCDLLLSPHPTCSDCCTTGDTTSHLRCGNDSLARRHSIGPLRRTPILHKSKQSDSTIRTDRELPALHFNFS